jgi:hypothetical protein
MSLLTDDIEYYASGRSPVSGTYKGKDEVLGLFGKMMEFLEEPSRWRFRTYWPTASMVSL